MPLTSRLLCRVTAIGDPRRAAEAGGSAAGGRLLQIAARLSALLIFSQSILIQSIPALDLNDLAAGEARASFRVQALYVARDGAAIGAGFVHIPTGIVLDLLPAPESPEAILWVRSLPVSHRGEPLVLQRLLLEDGLAQSGLLQSCKVDPCWVHATTMPSRTIFHLGGPCAAVSFAELLARFLRGLLDPELRADRIRALTWSLDVATGGSEETLRLIETGQLHAESVERASDPHAIVRDQIYTLCFGRDHPLGLPAQGTPDGLRTLTPDHLRDFFRDVYYPDSRLGILLFYPVTLPEAPSAGLRVAGAEGAPLDDLLAGLDANLRTLRSARQAVDESTGAASWRRTPRSVPPFAPRDASAIYQLPFPASDAAAPGVVALAWRPHAGLSATAVLRLRLLWRCLERILAQDPALGAPRAEIPRIAGQPPLLWIEDVAPSRMRPDSLIELRSRILSRIEELATLADDAPLLAARRANAADELRALQRSLDERLHSGTTAGDREASLFWVTHLQEVRDGPGFRKELALGATFDEVAASLAAGNPWTALIDQLELRRAPYLVAARPDTSLPRTLAAAQAARLSEATAALQEHFGSPDPQQALREFREFRRARHQAGR